MDLDDTSRCPLAPECAGCGAAAGLRVWTAGARTLGVFCTTLCEACELAPPARRSTLAVLELVGAHCGHLGIDLDQMAELLEAERGR